MILICGKRFHGRKGGHYGRNQNPYPRNRAYEGMHAAMDRAAQAYPNVQMDVFTGDLDVGVSIVQRMPPNSYDCIISRGGTANLIRQHAI